MKKIVLATLALNLFGGITFVNHTSAAPMLSFEKRLGKIDIKIKNDTDDEITVINAGSGGTYRLQKNITTTIKMDVGDQLFVYEKGKKGRLLLSATDGMNGKVQLLSKL